MADPAFKLSSQQSPSLPGDLKEYFGTLSSALQSIDLFVSQQLNAGPYKILYSVFNDTLAAGTKRNLRNTSQPISTEDEELNRATAMLLDENKRSASLTQELNQAFQTLRTVTETKDFQEKATNASFLRDLVGSFNYIVISSPNKNDWAAYPELLARFYIAISSVNDYIVKRIQNPDSKTIQDDAKDTPKTHDQSDDDSFHGVGHITIGNDSQTEPEDQVNQTQSKREKLEARFANDLKEVNRLIGTLDTPISWEDFKEKYGSSFEVLRDAEADTLLKTVFTDYSKNKGWDHIEKNQPRQRIEVPVTNAKEAEAARQAIKEATIKYGNLSQRQIEEILYERNLTLLTTEFKQSLVDFSSDIATHPERESLQETLNKRASELDLSNSATSAPLTFEQHLYDKPRLRALLEYYSPVIPLFERVPPQILTALLEEFPGATEKDRNDLIARLETVRLTQQSEIRKENGGKLPVYLELKDFDDPKLQTLIMSTKGDVLQKLTELNAKVIQKGLSPKTTHRALTQTYKQTQQNVQNKKKSLDSLSISERQGVEFDLAQRAYNDEVAVLEIQTEYFNQEALENQNLSIRQRVAKAFGRAQENQEVIIHPDARLADSWGFETLDTSDSDADFESQSGEERDNYLSGLADSKRPANPAATRRKLSVVKQGMSKLGTVLKNPAFLVGAAGGVATGAGLLYAFSQGVATGAGALSAAATGAGIGFAVGGPVGALAGAGIATIGSLVPIGGQSAANWFGTNVLHLADPGTIDGIRSAANLGQQGFSAAADAASKVAPETAMNASKTAGGLLNNGQAAASHLAGRVSTSIPKALAAFQTSGTAVSTGAVVQLVAAPLIVVSVTGYIVSYMLTSAFITPGEIPCYDNVDISICKIASPSSAMSVVDVVYQVTITAKAGNLTLTKITDTMTVQGSSDTTVPPAPIAPDPMTLKTTTGANLKGLTIPQGTTISYSYTLPLTGKNEYFNTRIVNNLTVEYSGGSDNKMTAKAAVTFGVVNISTCWPAPGQITQGPWGSFSHSTLNEDAIDIGGNAGAEIYAPFDGTLTYKIDPNGYGNYAVLQANGYRYYFGHMISVPGNGITTTVRKGDAIGNVGDSGNAKGIHLHYELQPADSNRVSNLNQFLPEPVDANGTNNGSIVHTDSPLCGPN